VLGAGSFGTTLAIHLCEAGHEVRLWGRDAAGMDQMARERENRKFLAGIALPVGVKVHAELERALEQADFQLFVVPSQALRAVARQVAATGSRGVPVCASKGLELGTLRRLSEVLVESLGDPAPVILTGPSHAEEVARGIPTTVVAASADEARARDVQRLCSTPRFRVYTNPDVVGCEMAGALKNVLAIGAGIADGLGYGDNTKAALMTRGLAELARLGAAMGGDPLTFAGLAWMGDLIATCSSPQSRNRHVGMELGKGRALDDVISEMNMVAEGVKSTTAVLELAARHGVEMPLASFVQRVLYEGARPADLVPELMLRKAKPELHGMR